MSWRKIWTQSLESPRMILSQRKAQLAEYRSVSVDGTAAKCHDTLLVGRHPGDPPLISSSIAYPPYTTYSHPHSHISLSTACVICSVALVLRLNRPLFLARGRMMKAQPHSFSYRGHGVGNRSFELSHDLNKISDIESRGDESPRLEPGSS